MQRILDCTPGTPLPSLSGGAATIGVFDGVHLGHRAILERTIACARDLGRPAAALTFSVHPDRLLRGRAPRTLQSLEHRLQAMDELGLDGAVVLEFDARLRDRSAEEFVDLYLVRALAIRRLVLGHDTAIGQDRRGDASLLRELGGRLGFTVEVVGEVCIGGVPISSTTIRSALESGDLAAARAMLGRAPSVLGRVVEGARRGRTLGFPTANLDVREDCVPAAGVYAVLVREEARVHRGVCNIGLRPTFDAGPHVVVEVHLLGFSGDLYGRLLRVDFIERLRPEQRFADAAALRLQIARDIDAARASFAAWTAP